MSTATRLCRTASLFLILAAGSCVGPQIQVQSDVVRTDMIVVGMIVIGLAGFLSDRILVGAFRLLTRGRPLVK